MIYEFRIYKLHPGRFEAFRERFENHALRFFAKHGIQFRGVWELGTFPEDSIPQASAGGIVREAMGSHFDGDRVAYLVSFESIEQRDRAWLDFVADEDWRAIKAQTEADGPIVKDETSFLMRDIGQ